MGVQKKDKEETAKFIAAAWGTELNQYCPLSSSDDLCLLFCIYPSCNRLLEGGGRLFTIKGRGETKISDKCNSAKCEISVLKEPIALGRNSIFFKPVPTSLQQNTVTYNFHIISAKTATTFFIKYILNSNIQNSIDA